MKKIITLALVAIILALCLTGIKMLGLDEKDDVKSIVTEWGITDIGELATAEYYYTKVMHHDGNPKEIFGIDLKWTTNHFTYTVDGYIKAGIDFSKVDISIDENKMKITVKLPDAKILDNVIDPDSLKVFDEKNSIFDPIDVDTVIKTESEIMKEAEAEAIEKGVIVRAEENAETMIKALVSGTVPEGYEVVVK